MIEYGLNQFVTLIIIVIACYSILITYIELVYLLASSLPYLIGKKTAALFSKSNMSISAPFQNELALTSISSVSTGKRAQMGFS